RPQRFIRTFDILELRLRHLTTSRCSFLEPCPVVDVLRREVVEDFGEDSPPLPRCQVVGREHAETLRSFLVDRPRDHDRRYDTLRASTVLRDQTVDERLPDLHQWIVHLLTSDTADGLNPSGGRSRGGEP